MVTQALTLAEIAGLPAVTDLVTAGRALGLGRTKAYELARSRAVPLPGHPGRPAPGSSPPPGCSPSSACLSPARPARSDTAGPPHLTGPGEPRVDAPDQRIPRARQPAPPDRRSPDRRRTR